jgi:hypothetical protein
LTYVNLLLPRGRGPVKILSKMALVP